MAQIPSTSAFSEGDGLNTYFNIDTSNKIVQLLNGTTLRFYSDGGSTLTGRINNAAQSATSPDPGNAGTIATSGVTVARVTPTAAETGMILAAGTIPGQFCWVVNEATTVSFSITFDVSGTSNVADGTDCVIPGGQALPFVWDSVTSLWYSCPTLGQGTIAPTQSATAPTIANAGTITTNGVGVARVAPSAARTGIIMQAGTFPGQLCLVVNESAAANSVTFNTTAATANVADSANEPPIYGLTARLFVWDSSTSFWYPVGNFLNSGTVAPLQSSTAVAIANAGTIATANLGVSRVNPASAVTGIILAAGTIPGQLCLVVNEAAAANSVTFNTTPATANVADSANEQPIYGLQARLFVWDSGTSLWYPIGNPLTGGTTNSLQSATAAATANAGTIATANVGVARVNPAAAVTGVILAAGTIPGQQVWVVNEAAAANSVQFDVSGTSNVADGTNQIIYGGQGRRFVWDSGQSLWYATSPTVGGTVVTSQSATAPVIAASGTITTAGVGVARVAPSAARAGIIMQAGTLPGQQVVVVNESTGANTLTFAASGTSNVADGTSDVINGLTARKYVWDSVQALWFPMV